jgi:hypothetical protein
MSNLYRGPSMDASYQVSVHLASGFRGEDFFKSANQKQELPVAPCLITDQKKISSLYRGPSTYTSYQVSVHLAEGFQRRRLKCEKLTDDGRRTPGDSKRSHCLWQGELKNFHGTC